MSADSPKVRDFTTQAQSLAVTVESSPVYELLLSMFAWGTKNDTGDYEYAPTCFERLEDGVTGPEAEKLGVLTESGELWLPLIGIAQSSGRTGSVESFLDYLEAMDPTELRRSLIADGCCHGQVDPDSAAAAASGDMAVIADLADHEKMSPGFLRFLKTEVTRSPQWLADILRAVYAVLERPIADTMPALERDADEKRALGRTMDAPRLVEAATNGVTFKMQPQITGVMLIPCKIIRPWNVIIEHEGLRIFAYSVADEHLMADPDAPPAYLVDLYKALGDERRLRMLSILSEENASLMEIAERVGLAKSTAHHHLRILRTAGLVRITVGDTKSYSLRRDTIPEASRLLDAFLTTPVATSAAAGTPHSERT